MDFPSEMNRIVGAAQAEANAALEGDDYAEAKRVLTGAVRDLRDLKRQLMDDERKVRESYQDARSQTRQSGQMVGLFMGSKTRGAMARGRAIQGRQLSAKQAEALRPYAHLKAEADRAIAAVNNAKAQITEQAAEAKESGGSPKPKTVSTPPPPPGAPVEPPAWRPDPAGKHEHRYWDGAQWTHHVADAGVASTDPL